MFRAAIIYSILFVGTIIVYGQRHPLSKSDSGVVLQNLEKYEYLSKENDLRSASRALNDIAFVYWNNNQYDEAARYYERSLELNEKIGNENGMAMINNNLGMLYADLGKYEQSLERFIKTLAARRAADEPVGIISALVNMSVVLNHLGRFEESIGYLSEALDIAREMYDQEQMRSVYGMLSETYEKMGKVDESLHYFSLYKTFHEEIQKEKLQTVTKELSETRLKKQLAEAEKAKKENELLKKQLELYDKEEELLVKDSINDSLYSNLSRTKLQVQLLETDKKLKSLEAEAKAAENKKLQDQQAYLRNTLIIVIVAMLIIGILIMINIRRSKRHTLELERKNQSIEKQRKELETANHTKDRIFSIIAHDLRSPISSLQGFFYALEELEIPKQFRSALKNVEEQLTNSAALLDNLLNWSRSQISNDDPVVQNVEIAKIVDDNFRLLQFQAAQKEIKLVSEVGPKDIIKTDPQHVNIVLRNLLQNAIKFTPKEGSITVNYSQSNGSTFLKVKDTGVGMDEDKLGTLFNISTNRSTQGTEKEKGSGLGLILCKELIEKVGGNIEVSSKPGSGSEFSLKFRNN